MTSSDRRGPRQVPPPQGSTTRPAGHYTRFIPREELSAFSNWTPDAFVGLADETEPVPVGLRRAPTVPVEPPPAPEPPPLAGPSEEDWLQRVQEARQQGYQDGYRDGLQALDAARRQHLQQVTAQFAGLASAFEDQMMALEQRMAEAVTATALALARQVVRSELSQRPELVRQVAQEAIGAVVLSARHLRLRLHPEDLSLVAADDGELLRSREVQLQPDPGLQRGGCVVESDLGRVDARIGQRWAQAVAVFGADLPLDGDTAPGGDAP
ncbi:flagellar biosynthesis protein [Ideonella sp. 4Y16]|uniref:Flagellar assembly protein FliH n=1 Tax=Ideonella alba TaxID=2824118 RepID=A0A940Y4Q2_9BURK|nr:FliH/SctL family protein [Ideonella alba]MBQ0929737.1 flagellar biosynthesis protein [Ideonella alba]MBQ0941977.1 flagellar biosynthesis protein [Ideonella alba]